jgi:hypothetical protein
MVSLKQKMRNNRLIQNRIAFIYCNTLQMTKKDYVLQVFEALKWISPIADNLAIILQHTEINEETLDQIITIFNNSMKDIKDKESIEKLKKWVEILEKIKEMEIKSKKKDEEDLKNLDILLQAL